ARTRRTVPHDHAEAIRVERREMDPQDRIPGGRSQGLLGSARLLELSGTVVQRPLRDGLDAFGIRDLGFGIWDSGRSRDSGLDFGGADPEPPNPRSPESPNPKPRIPRWYRV